MRKRKIKRLQFKNFRIYKDLYGKPCKRNWVAKVVFLIQMLLKPGFHMIVRIVPITPVVSKYFETIRTTGAIGSFHYDRLNRLKGKRHRVVNDVSGSDNRIFVHVLQTSHIIG